MAEKDVFGKELKRKDDEDDKGKKKKRIDDRGAADDWEALAMVIN